MQVPKCAKMAVVLTMTLLLVAAAEAHYGKLGRTLTIVNQGGDPAIVTGGTLLSLRSDVRGKVNGTVIGRSAGICTPLPGGKSFWCTQTFSLTAPYSGILAIEGEQFNTGSSTVIVVSATGVYARFSKATFTQDNTAGWFQYVLR